MTPPTVFIVDDDPAIRDSLALLMEINSLRVECHDGAKAFLEAYRQDRPGCLILDARMPDMSGSELQAELARRGSRLPVIFLSAHGDIPATVRAIKAGAVDFLTKPVDGGQLLKQVEMALRQNRREIEQLRALEGRCARLAGLTSREREILALVLAGESNKSISKTLGISHRTVEIHRSHILHKTAAANALELAQLAADCGFVAGRNDPSGKLATENKGPRAENRPT